MAFVVFIVVAVSAVHVDSKTYTVAREREQST